MKLIAGLLLSSAICLCQAGCGGHVTTLGQSGGSQNKQGASSPDVNQPANEARIEHLSGEAHWGKANSLRDSGRYEAAVKEYNLAIDNGYDTNEVRTEMGIVLAYYLHRHEEAIEQFRIAIQRDETDWRAHWSLTQSLLETQQYKEALNELEVVKRLDPENTSRGFYTYYTAKALDGLGKYYEALKDYEAFLKRAEKIEPNSSRVNEVKARVEAIKGSLNVS